MIETGSVPNLDEIAADPTRAADLPSETRRALTLRALAVIGVLAIAEAQADDRDRAHPTTPTPSGDEYLSIRSLARRIPYDEQTIRNFISQGVFRRDVHYVKPQGKGRPVFKWSAVRARLEGRPCPAPPFDIPSRLRRYVRIGFADGQVGSTRRGGADADTGNDEERPR